MKYYFTRAITFSLKISTREISSRKISIIVAENFWLQYISFLLTRKKKF